MQPEAPAQKPRSERHLVRWIFIGILAILGWYGWKAYDFRMAVKEAEALRWSFNFSDPIADSEQNLKNVYHKRPSVRSTRNLRVQNTNELERHFDLIRRLDPTNLRIEGTFPQRDLSELRGLSKLTVLDLWYCPNLTNIDTLKDMKGLTSLSIQFAPALANIDALKELKNLKELGLAGCGALTNLDALRDLNALKLLNLSFCAGLKDLRGILGLTELESLNLLGSVGLTEESVAALVTALPKTKVGVTH